MVSPARVLATRCPHCHTIFRVVADQLKLRDGLVRCGNCREVFDGRAHLCDPPESEDETDATPSPETLTPPVPHVAAPVTSSTHDTPPASARDLPEPHDGQSPASPVIPSLFARDHLPPGTPHTYDLFAASREGDDARVEPTVGNTPADTRPPVPELMTPMAIAALLNMPDTGTTRPLRRKDETPVEPDVAGDPSPADTSAPTVAHHADTAATRHAPDQRSVVSTAGTLSAADAGILHTATLPDSETAATPPSRYRPIIWRAAIVIATIGVIGQWAWIERASLIDRWPALHGLFATIGKPAHAQVSLAREPESVSLSTVTLVVDPSDSDTPASAVTASPEVASAAAAAIAQGAVPMTLTVFIRNKADHAIAWPSLELTLSDFDAHPVVRRAFSSADYIADPKLRDAGLPPRSERTIRLRLTAQAALASNYRVLAFYP